MAWSPGPAPPRALMVPPSPQTLDGHMVVRSHARVSSLTLKSIQYTDAGEYVCTASNTIGQDSQSMYLEVQCEGNSGKTGAGRAGQGLDDRGNQRPGPAFGYVKAMSPRPSLGFLQVCMSPGAAVGGSPNLCCPTPPLTPALALLQGTPAFPVPGDWVWRAPAQWQFSESRCPSLQMPPSCRALWLCTRGRGTR